MVNSTTQRCNLKQTFYLCCLGFGPLVCPDCKVFQLLLPEATSEAEEELGFLLFFIFQKHGNLSQKPPNGLPLKWDWPTVCHMFMTKPKPEGRMGHRGCIRPHKSPPETREEPYLSCRAWPPTPAQRWSSVSKGRVWGDGCR